MKKLFISLCLLVITTSIYAQAPEKFSYQAIIRDASDALVIDTNVSIRISIVQGSATGTTVVYSETHNPMTNFTGVVSLLIGDGIVVSGSLNTIDWGNDSYYIKAETDLSGGTNYDIAGTAQLLSTSFGLTSVNTDRALSVDYNNLTNAPTTITTEQADKINFLSITSAVDVNQILTEAATNTAKTSFPGFGTTAGTAFDIIWSKIGDHVYYDTAKVGIGFTDATAFGSAVLGVQDGIILSNTNDEVAQATPGSLFYEGSAKGFMFYYDNTGTLRSLGTGDITFNTRSNVFTEESIVKNRVAIGDDVTTGMEFGENDMIISDNTIGIWFNDTSASASFPNNDWVIKINDISDNGENYFAVLDTTANRTPFRVMAGAPDKSLEVNANGSINIGDLVPTEKIEVDGVVTATSFVGSGANLTNLSGAGTTITSNTGSTTIGADNDSDTNGSIIFETEQNSRVRIESDGSVNNGTLDPSNLLSISGDAQFNNLTAQKLSIGNSIQTSVVTETTLTNFSSYNVKDKSIVVINNNASIFINGLTVGVTGQKVHLINIHPTNTITLIPNQMIFPPSLGNPVLNQNESISFIYNGSSWVVTDFVGTP